MGFFSSARKHDSWSDWMHHRIKRMRRHGSVGAWARNWFAAETRSRMRVNYAADGLGVRGKNMSFLKDPKFAAAWQEAVRLNQEGWKGDVPNIE